MFDFFFLNEINELIMKSFDKKARHAVKLYYLPPSYEKKETGV